MDLRHGGWSGLECAADERLDVVEDRRVDGALDTVSGVLLRGRGLQRRRCLLGASLGCAGDPLLHLVSVWERLTEGSGRRQRKGSIS